MDDDERELADAWVDQIDDVARLRQLLKDKAHQLFLAIEAKNAVRDEYVHRLEEQRLKMHAAQARAERLEANLEGRKATEERLRHRLRREVERNDQRLAWLAEALGVAVPDRRRWRGLLAIVRGLRP